MDLKRVHIACGERRPPGYIHVDVREEVEPDIVCDVSDLPEHFQENSVHEFYWCHGLEHIPRPLQLSTLGLLKPLLKPGGILRLAVPDFQAMAGLYIAGGVQLQRLLGLLHGRQNYPENTHYCSYDYETLAWVLTKAGFIDVTRYNPWEMFPPDYDDYSKARINDICVSLNMVCRKSPS